MLNHCLVPIDATPGPKSLHAANERVPRAEVRVQKITRRKISGGKTRRKRKTSAAAAAVVEAVSQV
jgi:hypothetical protein